MIGNLTRGSGQTENEAVKQTDFRARRTSIRWAFADHMNCFVTGDRAPSSPEGSKMLTRAAAALDRPMILFQNIVEILHGAVLAVVGQIACGLEHGNGRVAKRQSSSVSSTSSRNAKYIFTSS
jgi:hypothetical protein